MGYYGYVIRYPIGVFKKKETNMAKCSNPHCKCINCTCGDNCTCTVDKCNCPPECNEPPKK